MRKAIEKSSDVTSTACTRIATLSCQILVALALCSLAAACGDDEVSDDAADEQGGHSGSDGTAGERSGSSGGGTGGDRSPPAGMTSFDPGPFTCKPFPDAREQPCLACLAHSCCEGLQRCSISVGQYPDGEDGAYIYRYNCYDHLMSCVERCFAEELEANSTSTSQDVLESCTARCLDEDWANWNPWGPEHRPQYDSLYACAFGFASGDADGGIDDADGGAAAGDGSCIEACFPNWQ